MIKILISWIGDTDLDASKPPEKRKVRKQIGLGPICEAIKNRNFDKVFLLENYNHKGRKEELESYLKWLRSQIEIPVNLLSETLDNPTDYQAIYDICLQRVTEIYDQEKNEKKVTFHLSPGTPQMHTVWVILSKTHFDKVSLIQSSMEGGVKDVVIPFKIAPQLIEDFVRSTDEKLENLTAAKTAKTDSFDDIIGKSEAIQRVKDRARKATVNNYPVLILGETGTGKELFATAIHNESSRKAKEIVTVNCGAFPKELIESELFGYVKGAFTGAIKDHEGFFKQAHKSTLFLDEIGDLPLKAQVKLLRVLQSKKFRPIGAKQDEEVDVRIIAATHQNLHKMIKKGTFREDLFYRLNVLVLNIPPLRERKEDLELLIDHLLKKIKTDNKDIDVEHKYFSANAKNILFNYNWPGNVRELQSVLVKTTIYSNHLEMSANDVNEALSFPISATKRKSETTHQESMVETKQEIPQPLTEQILNRPLGGTLKIKDVMSEVAKHYLDRALEQTHGNKTKAAKLIGLGSYQSLTNWMNPKDKKKSENTSGT